MDINQLTDELFNRAPTLARVLKAPSRETCRAVILAAVDSSNSLELLLGHGVVCWPIPSATDWLPLPRPLDDRPSVPRGGFAAGHRR